MPVLGLDVGEKRIGVALAEGSIAVPLMVIQRVEEAADLQQVISLAQEHGADIIVIGLPRSMDGSIGAQAEAVLEFAAALGYITDIPVDTYDERLSTVEAERLMREAGTKRGRMKENVDAMAAAVILQGYIDRMDT
jgi:putative Holliday junction resolvase